MKKMDDAIWHLKTIKEKVLLVDNLNAYSHMAIYLRWCIEHDLMSEEFMQKYANMVQQLKATPTDIDLRIFIQDKLNGKLFSSLFNSRGRDFASYYYGCYYGENESPCFPSDIDNYAINSIGQERNYSDEIQDEAYLFIPFDEEYYQAIAKVIERRFINWQGQSFDESTKEPSELAETMIKYLNCECTYFPSMKDDDPITSAYSYCRRDCLHEGFVPILIKVDEVLWECFIMNSNPSSDGKDDYTFDLNQVEEYRKKILASSIKDGKAILEEYINLRKEEAEDDEIDWKEEILGEMKGGFENNRFLGYWNYDTDMTYPLILAKIPVKNPWEIFAYLPFGGWNECPDTEELIAITKYWFEQYGAMPTVITHDVLEFELQKAVPEDKAMNIALEMYGFCPDIIDQNPENTTVGNLANTLKQSTVWYFWWD